MPNQTMTDARGEERKRLTRERQKAVRNAWKEEQNRVREGRGTRDWSLDEQKQLLETGRVEGYEGHHMKSVKEYPNEAGNPENIQFLTEDEHLNGAHQGSFHHATNGYYDPGTGQMNEFSGEELTPLSEVTLTNPFHEVESDIQNDNGYLGTTTDQTSDAGSGHADSYMGTAQSSFDSVEKEGGTSNEHTAGME